MRTLSLSRPSRAIGGSLVLLGTTVVGIIACTSEQTNQGEGAGGAVSSVQTAGPTTATTDGVGGGVFTVGAGGGSSASTGSAMAPPPSAYVPADQGAWALGMAISGDGVTGTGLDASNGCNTLVGVVRDFKGTNEPGGHPDFEAFSGDAPTPGLVAATLGSDNKPVYASQCEATLLGNCPYGQQTTSKMYFDQWYRFVDGVNKPYLLYFKFAPNGEISTFASTHFFPLDNAGWGNSGTGNDGLQHNFGFTTELHTKFQYNGGEKFTFTGDDDLWVFINHELAIDLGGLHPAVSGTADLDAMAGTLGIQKGKVYPLELFHAERHTDASNFHVDTNLAFVDCGSVPPDVPK